MTKHCKVYFAYFGYGIDSFVPCEVCGSRSTDVHHVKYKSRGGKDVIENLMGVCRTCHDKAHREELKESELSEIHLQFLRNERK